MTVSLKPHHVLCSIGYEGRGYDAPFVANMTRVVLGGLRGPRGTETPIRITFTADTICAPCPNRRGLGCASQGRVAELDARHATALGLRHGQSLTWGEAVDRVRRNIVPGDLDRICACCQWLGEGVCKRAVATLLADAARLEPAEG